VRGGAGVRPVPATPRVGRHVFVEEAYAALSYRARLALSIGSRAWDGNAAASRPTSPDGWFTAEHNTSQLAHYLCVTRPALSKEISKMVREGLIAVEGRRYRLLAEQQLRQEMG